MQLDRLAVAVLLLVYAALALLAAWLTWRQRWREGMTVAKTAVEAAAVVTGNTDKLVAGHSRVATGTRPWGAEFSKDSKHVFVSTNGGIWVYEVVTTKGGSRSLKFVRREKYGVPGARSAGLAVSPDGKFVAVAVGEPGVAVYRTEDLLTGKTAALAGVANSGTLSRKGKTRATNELEFSPDGAALVATDEYQYRVGIYALSGEGVPTLRTTIPTGAAPVGMAFTDATTVLVTSQSDPKFVDATCKTGKGGSLAAIDTVTAKVLARVQVGCEPVRVTVGPTGVYVSSRATDSVVVLDPVTLAPPGRHVRVGTAPVGLKLAANNAVLVVAASNRFEAGGTGKINLVDVARGRVARTLQALGFPRDVAVSPDGTMAVVTNYSSAKLSVLDVPAVMKS